MASTTKLTNFHQHLAQEITKVFLANGRSLTVVNVLIKGLMSPDPEFYKWATAQMTREELQFFAEKAVQRFPSLVM